MKGDKIFMKDYEHPTQEEIEKYRRERQRESEGGRKGGKMRGRKGGQRPQKNE
jgi:hypothetical protein